jgi:hypothetical protein
VQRQLYVPSSQHQKIIHSLQKAIYCVLMFHTRKSIIYLSSVKSLIFVIVVQRIFFFFGNELDIWPTFFPQAQKEYVLLVVTSIGLWLCYITSNIAVTILDIINPSIVYLKLSSTLQVCPYLTRNTLRLRYEPNRLMVSIGLWRCYINITVTVLDIINRPVFWRCATGHSSSCL